MWQILDGLWLGDRDDAADIARLRKAGITHILNCAIEIPCYHPDEFAYWELRMHDPDPEFARKIVGAFQFIDEARSEGGVLVHCMAAVSRSPSTILAYLCHLGNEMPAAVEMLRTVVATDPDPAFLRQINAFFEAGHDDTVLADLSRRLYTRG